MTNSHDNQTMKNNVNQYNKTQEGSELQRTFPQNKTVELEMAESTGGKYRREVQEGSTGGKQHKLESRADQEQTEHVLLTDTF